MTRFVCPGCGSAVEVPVPGADPFGADSVGCYNVEDHDDGDPLVMYAEEGSA